MTDENQEIRNADAPRACAWGMLRDSVRERSGLLLAICNLFIQFMAFSAVGWAYEIINDLICRHGLFPRASLAGPWCPIYGIGGLLIVLCLNKIPKTSRHGLAKLLEVVGAAVGICLLVTVVELLGSYVCEWMMGFMPWDYFDYWGNFEGRIAPAFTIRFVIGGLVFLYALDPLITRRCSKHPKGAKVLAAALLVLFALDNALESMGVWSGIIPREGILL